MIDGEDMKVIGAGLLIVLAAFVAVLVVAAAAGLAVNVFRLAGGF